MIRISNLPMCVWAGSRAGIQAREDGKRRGAGAPGTGDRAQGGCHTHIQHAFRIRVLPTYLGTVSVLVN